MRRRHSLLGFAIATATAGALLALAACSDDENGSDDPLAGQGGGGGKAGGNGQAGAGSGGTSGRQGAGGGTNGSGGSSGASGAAGSASGASGSGGGTGGASGGGAAGASGAGAGGSGGVGGQPPVAPGEPIATGQVNVRRMVSDGKSLFWAVAGTEAAGFNDGKVLSCPLDTCAPITTIAEGLKKPDFVSLSDENIGDDGNLYWTTSLGGEVMRCPKTGCGGEGPEVIAQNQAGPRGISVSNEAAGGKSRFVYWVNYDSGAIVRCPAAANCGGGVPESMLPEGEPAQKRPSTFLTGNTFAYWLNEGDAEGQGELVKLRKADKTLVRFKIGVGSGANMTLASSTIFAVDRGTAAAQYQDGSIVRAGIVTNVSLPDNVTTLASQQGALSDVVAEGTTGNVYWNSAGSLYFCPFAACPESGPAKLADGVGTGPLLEEGAFLYFVRDGEIRRLGKPTPPAPPTVVAPARPLSD